MLIVLIPYSFCKDAFKSTMIIEAKEISDTINTLYGHITTPHNSIIQGYSMGWIGCIWWVAINIFVISPRKEHGKRENDGARVCVKWVLASKQLNYQGATKLIDATIIMQWCNSMMGLGNECKSLVSRYF